MPPFPHALPTVHYASLVCARWTPTSSIRTHVLCRGLQALAPTCLVPSLLILVLTSSNVMCHPVILED
ncbi:hypothetical protein MPTK1_8g03990 [Marchantia polymorpha subsp. ruderalis]|uniref:Uncharacterized protein n=1 Tax=Marchantia polymorpha TaxID=3197 RepID=A0A2R6XJH2_MARPO|nr:hypothetical protein MARPO_0012s0188 [Marchantia polymorpha]BBN18617.1 hypothetical protein Mp_8g03990 [Marchantia polymorpha subsp. ruderalis]|eukprot:PTQ46263.1 hypothetical protein MARPO_0012s0188 [Marchantia polymorpha]